MSARTKRLVRVTDVRQEALDREQGEYGRALQEQERCRQEVRRAQERVEEARAERLRASGDFSIEEWRSKEAWLTELVRRVDLASAAALQQEDVVEQARARVAAAKTLVEQMNVVLERVSQEENRARTAQENKDEDELASSRWIAASKA